MNLAKYISSIISGHGTEMISDFIFVVVPVLSITILMFGLRSIFEDSLEPKLRKQ